MKFEYNPEISLGNILQILTILGGIAAGYATLVQANTIQDKNIEAHEAAITAIKVATKEAAGELKDNVKEIQKDVRKLDEKFTDYVIKSATNPKR